MLSDLVEINDIRRFLRKIHVFACIFLGSGGFTPPKIAGINPALPWVAGKARLKFFRRNIYAYCDYYFDNIFVVNLLFPAEKLY